MSTIRREKAPNSPLRAGQRLDRATFHALYETMPAGIKAELIGGVVTMPGPLGRRQGGVDGLVHYWLNHYRFRTPGLEVLGNASAALDDVGEPQPDAQLRILPEYGGQTTNFGKIVGGAPELIVEVSDSTRDTDLGPKLEDYSRSGVLEYLVALIDPDEVAWHVREAGRLVRVPPDPDGFFRSRAFPGLWLDPLALMFDHGPALVAALERGLATDEHAAFVARLAASRDAI
ncbi:MAG: hypothetical protein JWN86_4661 [Planctomycetota bacterium]|nr:hypothetical protein [Planctomycetota bacterium]